MQFKHQKQIPNHSCKQTRNLLYQNCHQITHLKQSNSHKIRQSAKLTEAKKISKWRLKAQALISLL